MPRSWNITLPDDEDYYTIREDQLDALSSGGKNMAMELVFFCGGAALGLLPSVGAVLMSLVNNKVVGLIDAGFTALAIGLGVYAIAKFLEAKSTKSDVDTLKAKIKAGQKIRVN